MAAPQFQLIGEQFVVAYYGMLDANQREQLLTMYHSTAMLTYENSQTQGHEGIKDLLANKVRFQTIQHQWTNVDCQPMDGGILVVVSGMLKTDDDRPIPYGETFVIKPVDGSYFIFNQVFRLSIHNM